MGSKRLTDLMRELHDVQFVVSANSDAKGTTDYDLLMVWEELGATKQRSIGSKLTVDDVIAGLCKEARYASNFNPVRKLEVEVVNVTNMRVVDTIQSVVGDLNSILEKYKDAKNKVDSYNKKSSEPEEAPSRCHASEFM